MFSRSQDRHKKYRCSLCEHEGRKVRVSEHFRRHHKDKNYSVIEGIDILAISDRQTPVRCPTPATSEPNENKAEEVFTDRPATNTTGLDKRDEILGTAVKAVGDCLLVQTEAAFNREMLGTLKSHSVTTNMNIGRLNAKSSLMSDSLERIEAQTRSIEAHMPEENKLRMMVTSIEGAAKRIETATERLQVSVKVMKDGLFTLIQSLIYGQRELTTQMAMQATSFREIMQSVNVILSKSDHIYQPSQAAPQIIPAAPQEEERLMYGQNEFEQHWKEATELKNDENNNVVKNSNTGRKTSPMHAHQESNNQDVVEDLQKACGKDSREPKTTDVNQERKSVSRKSVEKPHEEKKERKKEDLEKKRKHDDEDKSGKRLKSKILTLAEIRERRAAEAQRRERERRKEVEDRRRARKIRHSKIANAKKKLDRLHLKRQELKRIQEEERKRSCKTKELAVHLDADLRLSESSSSSEQSGEDRSWKRR